MQYPPLVTSIEEQRDSTGNTVALNFFTASGKVGTVELLQQTEQECPVPAVLDTQTSFYGFAPTSATAHLGKYCFYFEGSEQIHSQLRFY